MTNKKNIIIIEGPSGVGKDTIINELISRYPNRFARPINATTRKMRENESQGNPYLFLNDEEFHKLRATGEIFEHTIRHGTFRGMRRSSFEEILNSNKIALRDCDKYGLKALKEIYGNQVVGIFLTCDKAIIKERLLSRNEPLESMTVRLNDYDNCIKDAYYYDNVIENIELETTIKQILTIAGIEDTNNE